jgi:23S rRNA (cytosine1962-C5)-methyltransferase
MIELPKIETRKIAFKLTQKAEVLVKKGHPWVFDQSITKQSVEGKSGDLAILFDNRKNKFMACGFYDPSSPIRIKILQANKPANINADWFKNKIKEAYEIRLPLLKTATNSYRLIYGENDNLPSLIADVYSNVLVVKLYATFWLPYLSDILPEILAISNTKTLVLRLSRNVQKEGNEYGLADGQVIHGTLENEVIVFEEHGVAFSANVIHGHKTGYFLDHRANRKKVGQMANNKTVLDVFSYAGGFSVHALAGGATEVTSLDISGPALEIAKANAKLNNFKGTHSVIVGDAFDEMEILAQDRSKFDIVVIDPPSFAKSAIEVDRAIHSYKRLANLGLKLVSRGGTLVLASCSSRVTADVFFDLMEEVMQTAKVNYNVLETTNHDTDHPIGFKEGAYLKTIYIRIN